MALTRIRISTLRCLEDVEVELGPRRNYVFGRNGAGKTSLLEGIFLLGRGRSFRTRQTRRLVRHGDDGFAVYGEVDVDGVIRRLGIAYRGGRLEKRIDSDVAAGMGELAGLLSVHLIDPTMHALVEGGPSERRRFLDWGVFHVERSYLEAWKRFRRALSQRNAALKRGATPAELRSWTAAFLEAAKPVDDARRRYVERLAPAVSAFGARLLDRPLVIEYRRGWPDDAPLEEALRADEAHARQHGTTETGPHRAELLLRLEGRRAQDEVSRGQQKLTAAALLLAHVAVESTEHPGRSVLLLDDPAAELDAASLERLLGCVDDLQTQVIYTALTPAHLPVEPGDPVFHVERGEVRKL